MAAFFVTGMNLNKIYNTYFTPGNVSTDSRTIKSGDIFIALRGDNFNGNEYAESALNSGARIAIIDDPEYKKSKNTILVKDCLIFLQELATYHRKQCTGHFIGLTGTNGKTTTKELIFSVLSAKYSCQATSGNLNNHIGVPLTILSIRYNTEIAIIEMGANHVGEIESLCKISQPDSGLITNIGKAHLEGFGSIEGVIKAKSELYHYLMNIRNKIYVNSKDSLLMNLLDEYKNSIYYNDPSGFCEGEILESENSLKLKLTHNNSSITIDTNLFGDYNLNNILAASCVGIVFNLSLEQIKAGLENYQPTNQRSQLISSGSTKLFLDCYNANPTSMKESIMSFLKIPSGKKIVILGSMKELGDYSEEEHQKIGAILENTYIDHIFLIGKEFNIVKPERTIHINNLTELKDYLVKIDLDSTAILVKGSRANKLEQVQKFIFPDQPESN